MKLNIPDSINVSVKFVHSPTITNPPPSGEPTPVIANANHVKVAVSPPDCKA